MSESYSIANTDKITAEYLRNIGPDKQNFMQFTITKRKLNESNETRKMNSLETGLNLK